MLRRTAPGDRSARRPGIESFTLSGEMLASLPAALVAARLRDPPADAAARAGWWSAGLLTGCAVMIKQSGFDGGLAAVACTCCATRRRGDCCRPPLMVGCALRAGVARRCCRPRASTTGGTRWSATAARATRSCPGSPVDPGESVQGLAAGGRPCRSAPLVALAAIGWRRAPLLLRLWVAAAALAVIGGGNFHPHYYQQLCAPLAALAGVGAAALLPERHRWSLAVTRRLAALAVASVAGRSGSSPGTSGSRSLFPEDPHLLHSEPVVGWLRDNTDPGDQVFVLWAAADINYLADRDPAVPYLWYRNIQAIPGALDQVRASLASPDGPRYIVGAAPAAQARQERQDLRLLHDNFHRVGKVDGIVDLRAQLSGRLDQAGDPARCARSSVSISIHSAGVWSCAADRPQPVDRRHAPGARPAAVGHAARELARRSPGRSSRASASASSTSRRGAASAARCRGRDLDGDAVVGAAGARAAAARARGRRGRWSGCRAWPAPRPARCSRRRRRRPSSPPTSSPAGRRRAPSMRRISRASALTALRPRAVSAPAWAGTAGQLHRPPQRALARRDQVAVLAGALEDQGRRARPRRGPRRRDRAAAPPRRRRRAAAARENGRRSPGDALHRHRRQHQAALHVGDAGAEAAHPLAPERPLGDGAEREHGVGVAEQRDHARRPRRAARCTTLRAGQSGSAIHSADAPSGAQPPGQQLAPRAPARRRRTASRC